MNRLVRPFEYSVLFVGSFLNALENVIVCELVSENTY